MIKELSDQELSEIIGGNLVGQLWYDITYGYTAASHASVKYNVASFTGH